MIDFPAELESKMQARNFYIRGKINYSITGKFQRFPDAANKYKRSKDLFVILHDFDRGATFGNWKYPDDWYTHWNSAYGKPTINDMKARQEEIDKAKIEQAYERAKAEWRSRELWGKFYVTKVNANINHDYVTRKKITPYYARQVRSWLLIPVSDVDNKLVTLQIIKPDGFKRLWKGTSHKNNMVWLSSTLPENYSGIIRLCEGYATGCTIYSVTKSPVVCALNANNMPLVAGLLRDKYPLSIIKICADHDQWGSENAGLNYAVKASSACGGLIYWPDFDGLDISKKPTDFNDLFLLSDKETVKKQLIRIRKQA